MHIRPEHVQARSYPSPHPTPGICRAEFASQPRPNQQRRTSRPKTTGRERASEKGRCSGWRTKRNAHIQNKPIKKRKQSRLSTFLCRTREPGAFTFRKGSGTRKANPSDAALCIFLRQDCTLVSYSRANETKKKDRPWPHIRQKLLCNPESTTTWLLLCYQTSQEAILFRKQAFKKAGNWLETAELWLVFETSFAAVVAVQCFALL